MFRAKFLILGILVVSSTFASSQLTIDDIIESYKINSSAFSNKYSIEYEIQEQQSDGALKWQENYNKKLKEIDIIEGIVRPDDYYKVPLKPINKGWSYLKKKSADKLYFGIDRIETGEQVPQQKLSWDGKRYKIYNEIDKRGVIQQSFDFDLHFDARNFIGKVGEIDILSLLQSGEITKNEFKYMGDKKVLFVEIINHKNVASSEISEIESLKQITNLWLDPEKALLPVKIESGHILTLKNGKQYDEFPEEVVDNVELMISGGSWVLKSARRKQYRSNWNWTPGKNEPTREHQTLYATWTYNLRKLDTNPTFTESDFEVEFPNGTLFHDDYIDMAFIQGGMTEELEKIVDSIIDDEILNEVSNLEVFNKEKRPITKNETLNIESQSSQQQPVEQNKAEIEFEVGATLKEPANRITTIILIAIALIICSATIIYLKKRRDKLC